MTGTTRAGWILAGAVLRTTNTHPSWPASQSCSEELERENSHAHNPLPLLFDTLSIYLLSSQCEICLLRVRNMATRLSPAGGWKAVFPPVTPRPNVAMLLKSSFCHLLIVSSKGLQDGQEGRLVHSVHRRILAVDGPRRGSGPECRVWSCPPTKVACGRALRLSPRA